MYYLTDPEAHSSLSPTSLPEVQCLGLFSEAILKCNHFNHQESLHNLGYFISPSSFPVLLSTSLKRQDRTCGYFRRFLQQEVCLPLWPYLGSNYRHKQRPAMSLVELAFSIPGAF